METNENNKKYIQLAFSISFDLIGMMSFLVPFFGEFFDLIWAPISAMLLWVMYRKTYGAAAGVFGFFEEILPGIDILPTFTIMWFVKYYLIANEEQKKVIQQ